VLSSLEKVNPILDDTAARNNPIRGLPARRGSAQHLFPHQTFLLPPRGSAQHGAGSWTQMHPPEQPRALLGSAGPRRQGVQDTDK